MIAANGQTVAVAGYQPDIHLWIGQLDAGGKGGRPAMDGVETIGRHVIGKARGTADTRDEDNVLRRRTNIGQGFLHALQNGVVATTGTPSDFLIGGEILRL